MSESPKRPVPPPNTFKVGDAVMIPGQVLAVIGTDVQVTTVDPQKYGVSRTIFEVNAALVQPLAPEPAKGA